MSTHVHGPECAGHTPEVPVESEVPASIPGEEETNDVTCHVCNYFFSIDYMTSDDDGNLYCVPCYDDIFVICYSCEEATPRVDSYSAFRHVYCQACYNEAFVECDECGRAIYTDGAHCDSEGEGTYCVGCIPERGPIFSCSENPLNHLRKMGSPKDGIYFGVELEIEFSSGRIRSAEYFSERLRGYAILKEDGSLDQGWECVTAPATLAVHEEQMRGFLVGKRDKLLSFGATSHDNRSCGMHIHISRAPLTHLQIGKMQVFLHNPDNYQFVTCIAQRNPREWAEIASAKKLTDARKGGDQKYTALNLLNSNTVELRIFKGTLRFDRVMKNLEFAAALVRWCSAGEASIAECANFEPFVQWVLAHRKEYRHLVSFLREKSYLPKRDNPRVGPIEPQPEEITACA